MGSIYKRTEHHCAICHKRLSRTADREHCNAAGHKVEARQSSVWWIKYRRNRKSYDESSRSTRRKDAVALLQEREGDIVRGRPITPRIGKMTFEDGTADLLSDYTTNRMKSYAVVERRIRLHLAKYFEGRRMAEITTADVRAYIAQRQTTATVVVRKARKVTQPDGTVVQLPEQSRPASDAEINRELALLKRMYSLAIQAGRLLYRPHIPMLKENNVRTGFFEQEQLESVLAHLPAALQAVIEFAAITGWRIASEILPIQWRNVDFDAGEVRLDAGTTKNGEGRVFPMTAALRTVLQAQHAEHERLKEAGKIEPWVFFRIVDHRGKPDPKPITSFTKAWKSACRAAGCPGRIPHDLRRTAVRGLVRAGISERVAMQMTGHKTRSVFERYNIVSDGDLKDAAKRLDAAARLSMSARRG